MPHNEPSPILSGPAKLNALPLPFKIQISNFNFISHHLSSFFPLQIPVLGFRFPHFSLFSSLRQTNKKPQNPQNVLVFFRPQDQGTGRRRRQGNGVKTPQNPNGKPPSQRRPRERQETRWKGKPQARFRRRNPFVVSEAGDPSDGEGGGRPRQGRRISRPVVDGVRPER